MNIPLPGEASMRQEAAEMLKASIRTILMVAFQDQLSHAEFVARGQFEFRQRFVKEIGVFFDGNRSQADELANNVFRFLELKWQEKYPDTSAAFVLDKIDIPSPPTEQEIEDAWELEIGSSDSALRQNYEGSARTRKGKDLGSLPQDLSRRKH